MRRTTRHKRRGLGSAPSTHRQKGRDRYRDAFKSLKAAQADLTGGDTHMESLGLARPKSRAPAQAAVTKAAAMFQSGCLLPKYTGAKR